jgi:hypothetical protein
VTAHTGTTPAVHCGLPRRGAPRGESTHILVHARTHTSIRAYTFITHRERRGGDRSCLGFLTSSTDTWCSGRRSSGQRVCSARSRQRHQHRRVSARSWRCAILVKTNPTELFPFTFPSLCVCVSRACLGKASASFGHSPKQKPFLSRFLAVSSCLVLSCLVLSCRTRATRPSLTGRKNAFLASFSTKDDHSSKE